jgi:phosphoribosylformylglycinamidine synthase
VVSGNVSFNNENPKGSVDPTPIVGMVGLIKDRSKITTQYFKSAGDLILLLGRNKEELGGSEYLKTIHSRKIGRCPSVNLRLERGVQKTALEAIEKGLVRSAHDCSEGGLAVALAECCITNPAEKLGALINLKEGQMRKDALLFGESQSRIILSVKQKDLKKVLQIAKKNKAPVSLIGKVGGASLVINDLIKTKVTDLFKAYSASIESCLSYAAFRSQPLSARAGFNSSLTST